MDVQMPKIDGIKAAGAIRNFDKEIPIIALTSLDKDSFLKESKKSNVVNNFSYYLNKSNSS